MGIVAERQLASDSPFNPQNDLPGQFYVCLEEN